MDRGKRTQMLVAFGATFARIWDEPKKNFAAYWELRRVFEANLRGEFEEEGLRLPYFFWKAFWRKVFPISVPKEPEPFMQLLYAVATRCDDEVAAHMDQREAEAGNNFIEIWGLPGTGKSSATLGMIHKRRPFPPGSLGKRVLFDQEKVPEALTNVQSLEWIVLDEQTRGAGDGAKTSADELANVEEQFRAAQKNMAVLSPTEREHKAQGLRFMTFAWSREKQKVALLVQSSWPEPTWLGYVVWDFAPPEVWQEYQPLKNAQVERSVAAAFRDPTAMMRIVNAVAAKPQFVHFLTKAGKPKKKDFETAFKMYYSRNLSQRMMSSIVESAFTVCSHWEHYKDGKFREMFGIDPEPGLEQIAKKCYREN